MPSKLECTACWLPRRQTTLAGAGWQLFSSKCSTAGRRYARRVLQLIVKRQQDWQCVFMQRLHHSARLLTGHCVCHHNTMCCTELLTLTAWRSVMQVLTTEGDKSLVGDSWDILLADHMLSPLHSCCYDKGDIELLDITDSLPKVRTFIAIVPRALCLLVRNGSVQCAHRQGLRSHDVEGLVELPVHTVLQCS